MAERLAAPLQSIDLRIRRGEFDASALDEALLLDFHAALCRDLFPEDAGRYRQKAVQVGGHLPPAAHEVAQRMRDYTGNVVERMRHLGEEADDLLLEFLAYAEGELLSIHPFPDLNGRVSRLWMTEILRRLRLPPVDVVPPSAAFRARYLAALSAADERRWAPLAAVWAERLSQPADLNEIALPGCMPAPLASYLKALGILRLVAEAGDEGGGDGAVAGYWREDVFVLRTSLSVDRLTEFFLQRYCPTPLITPWNGSSGFYPNDNKEGIDALAASTVARFQDYRSAIEVGRAVVARLSLVESPKLEKKSDFLMALRNVAPDALLPWMDAAIAFSEAGPRYPPLLGTGGNDGRLDFTNNFMQRLADVIDLQSGTPLAGSRSTLESALFGRPVDALLRKTIGQFAPGAIGGPNAGSSSEGGAVLNAWDFILMLEGAIFFGASMTRRMESADAAILVAPFTVRSRSGAAGNAAAADDPNARGEVWMPLWTAPAGLHELQRLMAEGRSAVNGRPSRDGLDFARSVGQLGVDRGISGFQRFGFLERNGKAFFATPLNVVPVRRNPDADLIADLERHQWLAAVQRHAGDANAPQTFRSSARQLDAALFAMTQQPGRAAIQAVLRQLGRVEAVLNGSAKSRDAVRAPVPRLAVAWAMQADDGSAEFRIACALAAMSFSGPGGRAAFGIRRHLVAVGDPLNAQGDLKWEPASRAAVWRVGPLAGNLALLFHRRRLEAVAEGAEAGFLASRSGAGLGDVASFLEGGTDDRRIAELLAGLACVDLRRFGEPRALSNVQLPPAFAVLKVLFTPEHVLRSVGWLPDDSNLRLPAQIPARLLANDLQAAMVLAWQCLRAIGIALPGRSPPRAVGADGARWLAALCVPLTFAETGRMLRGLRSMFDSPTPSPTDRESAA